MKHLFVIRLHSVIDVITNSSSELFVIHGNKSIRAIKEAIKDIINVNNKTAEGHDDYDHRETTFEGAFDSEIKQIKTKEEAEKIFIDYSNYMLNNFSIAQQLMGAEHVFYEDDEVKKMIDSGKIDVAKNVKVGDIILHSADDNSIPWPIVETIEAMFDCERYHLG